MTIKNNNNDLQPQNYYYKLKQFFSVVVVVTVVVVVEHELHSLNNQIPNVVVAQKKKNIMKFHLVYLHDGIFLLPKRIYHLVDTPNFGQYAKLDEIKNDNFCFFGNQKCSF